MKQTLCKYYSPLQIYRENKTDEHNDKAIV